MDLHSLVRQVVSCNDFDCQFRRSSLSERQSGEMTTHRLELEAVFRDLVRPLLHMNFTVDADQDSPYAKNPSDSNDVVRRSAHLGINSARSQTPTTSVRED